jgi:hypothetical protein
MGCPRPKVGSAGQLVVTDRRWVALQGVQASTGKHTFEEHVRTQASRAAAQSALWELDAFTPNL